MSILSSLTALLSKAAKNQTIKAAVLSVALNVASSNIDKAGAKLKVPTEAIAVAKAALVKEASKQGDLLAKDVITRL
jgi:hypothetical protein